jgi:nucleoside-triphosphatase THEP1
VNKGGMMKKKGMARGGMKKKGYAAGGMTVPQLRAAAKAKGYKIMKG